MNAAGNCFNYKGVWDTKMKNYAKKMSTLFMILLVLMALNIHSATRCEILGDNTKSQV